MSELTTKQSFSLTPSSLTEAMAFADILAKSTIVPKEFLGNPGNILVAIQWGLELGLQPLQAMQNIAVINGRPALWGDAVIALVRGSPLCEYVYEEDDGHTATCRVKRRGENEQVRIYTMDDAKTAGLVGKAGPWTQHPKRMRQMRARAFALRDVFPDVLRGMPVAEELQDMPKERDNSQPLASVSKIEAPATLPNYPDELLTENIIKWQPLIDSGRTSPEHLISTISSKYTLSQAQIETITNLKALEGDAA
ncbi:hypothetical protein PS918_03092 [Pseudomonas fluorescens]|uniref:RecT family protein n=1 Tax=Pseudomonas fluorescens TaxID=294 RepID=A0A5E7SU43_PSEFL|nr:recombinase RecT [Pseudomonas fluorescens]VVP89500.1 hypothetical protein PS918_03092 [Pseudomonas fluorescens]